MTLLLGVRQDSGDGSTAARAWTIYFELLFMSPFPAERGSPTYSVPGLLFIFLSQIITGVFLALYYVPSADHAHTTVAYITKAVTGGSFLRSLHAYGASAMVIVLLLHLSQTYIYGAYKGRRELLWLSGCVLFGLVMAMAFTGYLLPWDQRAYFATGVGTNAVSEVPWIGESVKRLMRGGTEMGTLTISRFFVAHVFLIPAFIFALVASHIFLFRKAGAAGPVNEDPYHPKQKAELSTLAKC